MIVNTLKTAFIYALCLTGISCAGNRVTLEKNVLFHQPIQAVQGQYVLGPGDVIEITYHIAPKKTDRDYILAAGDVITVEFYYHPYMNRQLTIGPSGKITVPLKGDIEAAGLTPIELKDKISELFSDVFRSPMVTVTVVEYNVAIRKFIDSIVTSERGQSKVTTIGPGGFISFPLLDDMKAAGLTITQLKEKVSAEYNKLSESLFVSFMLQDMKSNLVYVLGEVKKPDYFLMKSTTTLTQILARSGGALDTAKLDTVLVVSRNEEGKPAGRLVNVKKILAEGNLADDILLKQYDIVYVPKTAIAEANLFIDQYINKLVPDFFRMNYGIGDFNR